jgi:tetratricopeptide (TPR) repeat protein
VIPDLHTAFPAGQTAGTRLVLTQPTYQLQRWLDWLGTRPGVTVLGEMVAADPRLLAEALARRGPWSRIDLAYADAVVSRDATRDAGPHARLRAAFLRPDPRERVDAATEAAHGDATNSALQLALASAWMEARRPDRAEAPLDRALAISPDWEAVHFEVGKWCLRTEQMERAAAAFADAVRLMPTFAAACGNLGAVLGELERPDQAVLALERALELDPNGYPVLNNFGALHRDAGRLTEAEAAFRTVIALAPDFVFGHYNLGQTLLLQGRPHEALNAYEAGAERDAQKNPRQGMRLAVARAAVQDPEGALQEVQSVLSRVSEELGQDLLAEAENTLEMLFERHAITTGAFARALDALRRYST